MKEPADRQKRGACCHGHLHGSRSSRDFQNVTRNSCISINTQNMLSEGEGSHSIWCMGQGWSPCWVRGEAGAIFSQSSFGRFAAASIRSLEQMVVLDLTLLLQRSRNPLLDKLEFSEIV